MSALAAIEVFFDYTCPYCYRGHQALLGLLPRYPSAALLWRPVEAHPITREPWFAPHSHLANQGALFVADCQGDALAYHQRIYQAHYREGLPIDDIPTLAMLAGQLGLDAQAFEAALSEGRYQQAQRQANAYAFGTSKVWAVPTLVLGDTRLDAVEDVGITSAQIEAFLTKVCTKG